jgi:hypothetical protein
MKGLVVKKYFIKNTEPGLPVVLVFTRAVIIQLVREMNLLQWRKHPDYCLRGAEVSNIRGNHRYSGGQLPGPFCQVGQDPC